MPIQPTPPIAMLALFSDGDSSTEEFASQRQRMVRFQLSGRGIQQEAVLDAFRRVPRHLFVPPSERCRAYHDHPLPIGCGQTISQPYVVAYMLQQLAVERPGRVLEIGTGCGYLTALLAEMVDRVFTIEFFPELAERAQHTLRELGYGNIRLRAGDGAKGWEEEAPFDGIIGSAAVEEVPPALIEQLALDSRLIMPVGADQQRLVMVQRRAQGVERRELIAVRFVPMR